MTNSPPQSLSALGICLEEYEYPYAVGFLPLTNDLQAVTMAYMDVPPAAEPSGMTVVLIHGKAFGGYYFRKVIEALTGSGHRVVVPDQIGPASQPSPRKRCTTTNCTGLTRPPSAATSRATSCTPTPRSTTRSPTS